MMTKIENKKVMFLFRAEAIVVLIITIFSILQRNDVGVFASFTWISTVKPIVFAIAAVSASIFLIARLNHNVKIKNEILSGERKDAEK